MTTIQQPPLRGELLNDEPLSGYTTWRVGGRVRQLYRPADLDDLGLFIHRLDDDEELHFIGLGSNLLVRDGGVGGTVILTHDLLAHIEQVNRQHLYVEAGVASAKASRFAARVGLAGTQFLSGIPGTVGGALAMNAGCFGSEIWPLVESVTLMNHHGEIIQRKPDEYEIGYRSVKGHHLGKSEWFISTILKLQNGDSEKLLEENRQLLERRSASQPTRLPSAGSVFRNPQGDHAARLIESCGLKGECIGQACISEKHANFIVNRGGASAADIEQLMGRVAEQVMAQCGVELEHEVKIIGKPLKGGVQ